MSGGYEAQHSREADNSGSVVPGSGPNVVGPSEVDVWSTSHDPLSPYHHHHHHQHAAYYGPVSLKRLLCVVFVFTSTLCIRQSVGSGQVMTELLTPPHPQPASYLNQSAAQQQQQQQQQQPQQQQNFVSDSSHPVDLSNSRPPPPLLSSPSAHAAAAAFYGGLEYRDRRDTYKPNGLSLSLGISDSGK